MVECVKVAAHTVNVGVDGAADDRLTLPIAHGELPNERTGSATGCAVSFPGELPMPIGLAAGTMSR